jgi:TrmH family RNA methyltransferase
MQVLTSPRNPLVKEVRKAILRGGLTGDGLCVAEGFNLLDEALRSNCEISPVFVLESARAAVEDRVGDLRAIRVIELPDELFHSISSTETSQGVIALVRPPAWTLDQLFQGHALVVVLDGVQDPGNSGAIVRSAEAFGVTGVVFLKGSVSPYNPKCLRASAGSVFRVPMVTGLEERALLAALDRHEIETYALAPSGAIEIAQCHFERRCALIVGSEGRGVSEGLRAKAIGVRIPTVAVESLNAAMATGIALYEARRKRVADEPV